VKVLLGFELIFLHLCVCVFVAAGALELWGHIITYNGGNLQSAGLDDLSLAGPGQLLQKDKGAANNR